ncbi:MAG TPA: discoidin domain-containing protein [Candidatus Paceibacterota bacterium]
MKSPLKKITSLVLAVAIVATSTNFMLQPKVAEAQAGGAAACTAGYIAAGLSALASVTQNVIGVSKSQVGDTAQNVTTGGSANALSFNNCILKPLAKAMIITIIRNVGGSIVNWINTGFEGKPSFVTDYKGTLLNSADEAIGTFIEGTDLGFLCNNFSFQIRIALALKYSQPFRQKATCTLSDIARNANAFARTNGGVGWDNWLALTTEPQNNVYGAYVMADSELTRRALEAATTKKDRIALGQGFLDYETCDRWEEIDDHGDLGSDGTDPEVLNNNTFLGAVNSSFSTTSSSGRDTAPVVKQGTRFVDPTGAQRKCIAKSTKTPGTIIAGKLQSTLGSDDIQRAVATEIDDVIAATMNQLAQKMIQGAQGLLGLSQKNGTANRQTYMERYQSQFYGVNATETINTGATSEIEDYTIANFEEANALILSNGLAQDIYAATASATNAAVNQNIQQQQAINGALGANNSTEQNFAFYKQATQSSIGAGSADKANNGVKDGAVSQYNQVAATGEERDPWWEVDLQESKEIREVRVWKVTNKPASQTLESFRVIATNEAGADSWTSPVITPAEGGNNPIIIPVGQSRRYVRIQKLSTLDPECRLVPADYFRGQDEYEACYHPLELAEVEIIGNANRAGLTAGIATSSASGTTMGPSVSNGPKTLNLIASSTSPLILSSSVPFLYDIQVAANHSTSSLAVETVIKRNGQTVSVGSVFSSLTVTTRRGNGAASITNVGLNAPGMRGNRISVSATEKFIFNFYGPKKVGAATGTYTVESILTDVNGEVVDTQITEFVVQ